MKSPAMKLLSHWLKEFLADEKVIFHSNRLAWWYFHVVIFKMKKKVDWFKRCSLLSSGGVGDVNARISSLWASLLVGHCHRFSSKFNLAWDFLVALVVLQSVALQISLTGNSTWGSRLQKTAEPKTRSFLFIWTSVSSKCGTEELLPKRWGLEWHTFQFFSSSRKFIEQPSCKHNQTFCYFISMYKLVENL